eukprot:194163-Pelagomonas_calceolata.AAC.1
MWAADAAHTGSSNGQEEQHARPQNCVRHPYRCRTPAAAAAAAAITTTTADTNTGDAAEWGAHPKDGLQQLLVGGHAMQNSCTAGRLLHHLPYQTADEACQRGQLHAAELQVAQQQQHAGACATATAALTNCLSKPGMLVLLLQVLLLLLLLVMIIMQLSVKRAMSDV